MKEKIKKINEEIKSGKHVEEIVVVTLILVATIVGFTIYRSRAIFDGTIEKRNAITIKAGLITFEVTSTNNSYDSSSKQITVSKGSEIELPLTITNKTPISAKYKLYYKLISPSTLPDGTVIAVAASKEENYDTGVLEKNSNEEKTIVIRNTGTNDITIELGVDGGYSYNELDLANGHNQLSFEKRINYYKDSSGANQPEIENTGLIPVVYDEDEDQWKVANPEEEWYDYNNQWWANAVTVSDASYRNKPAGTVLPMDVINSMWVWIPRYKYQIPSDIGSSSEITNPPQIDVEFENGTNTTGEELASCSIDATDCYYTHPAFRDGASATLLTSTQKSKGSHTGWDEELTGIWVGKFETGGTTSAPLIKPDITSLTKQTVSNQFKTSLKFAGGTMSSSGIVTFDGSDIYGLSNTVDTHMMKNTEWGAVAYLSQSKYGKNGNNNYTETDKEIYINNSSSYYTGRSYGAVNTKDVSTANGTYSYNGKSCSTTNSTTKECTGEKDILKGTGASTTGTIYGIYDMSGGAVEYVMGNWAETKDSSGFTKFPEQKYWDKYTGTSGTSITNAKAIKGDATYETMSWYSDDAVFAPSYSSWFKRGWFSNNRSNAGVFGSSYADGNAYSENTSRSVLIP